MGCDKENNLASLYFIRHAETPWNRVDSERIQTYSNWCPENCITQRGWYAALELGESLAKIEMLEHRPLIGIYSSSLNRTKQTAEAMRRGIIEAVAKSKGVKRVSSAEQSHLVQNSAGQKLTGQGLTGKGTGSIALFSEPRIDDASMGCFEGMLLEDFKNKYGDIFSKRHEDRFNYRPPRIDSLLQPEAECLPYETFGDLRERMNPFLENLISDVLEKEQSAIVVGHKSSLLVAFYCLAMNSDSKMQMPDLNIPNLGVYKAVLDKQGSAGCLQRLNGLKWDVIWEFFSMQPA